MDNSHNRDIPILCTCSQCTNKISIDVNQHDYYRWQDGSLIQKEMPYLTCDERELLISGVCGSCFDKMTF